MSHLPVIWIVVLLHLASTFASPIYAPQFLPGGTGRNIRHLPCVSLRSGETGVCMFAFTCAKSNGTHLGTCIDRFYFGSCCKLNDDVDIYPQDNTIEDASAASSFVTAGSAQESNDIPDYFTRPKPVVEKKPESSTSSTIGQTVSATSAQTIARTTTTSTTTTSTTTTTTTVRPSTTKAVPKTTQKIVTKRPTFFSTPYTTTQPPIGLSTFQTLYDYSHGSGSSTTPNHRPVSASRPTTVNRNATTTQTSTSSTTSGISGRPGISTSATTQGSPTITRKPISTSPTKPSITRKPITTSTTRPVVTTTERTSTRFPPRNATTTRPQHTTNTRKPVHQSTKKPTVTTKRPSTVTRRPTTTKQPPDVSTSRPPPTTEKTTSTSVKVTQTSRPSSPTSTQGTLTTFSAKPSSSSAPSSTHTRPSQRPFVTGPPSSSSPEKFNATSKPTTSKPATVSGRPRPSSRPTRPSSTSSGRPTTVKTTPRPQQITTERIKTTPSPPTPSTLSSFSHTRPSTFKPTTGATLKPKPTEKPSKPTKPSKPSSTTSTPTSTTSTTTEASTLSVTSLILNETTLANEILPPKTPVDVSTTEKISQTTQPPGLVTWSSNSDEDVTKAPPASSSTSETTHQASTEPEWSPITTPDGWIMIQSPTTEKTPADAAEATKPSTTEIPTTSAKPSTESATMDSMATTRPSIPAMLSTIATVTAATDLPVPMETLNMSDYTQVCGRRLFPESRIVGGDHSSFGKWPWQISLRQWRTAAYLHKCGAALLNENWAITAAHCVEHVPPSDLLLRIGEHDLANENEPYGFQERRVQIVASHPQFDPRTFEYDLALLRFYEPVLPFQPNLLPICLPDDDENYVGHTAYVTGWGRLYEDGPLPSVLQEVSVPVVNNTVCEGMYRNAGFSEHIPHIFICAGWRKGGFDSCEGDSGGPMVIQRPRDKRWILAGVISWGIGCAEPNQPGVYTRISEFREWINQILQF